MKRTASILIFLLALCQTIHGQEDMSLFAFGVKWGYSAQLFDVHKLVYRDDYGSLVSDQGAGFSFAGNGYILADFGFNISMKSRISVLSGFEGIAGNRGEIPIQLRYSLATKGYNQDGSLFFAGGGTGLPVDAKATAPSFCGLIGGGYRLSLGKRMSIDLTGSFKLTFDRPGIPDKSTGRYVPVSSIQRNNAMYASLSIGLGVNF